MEIRDTRNGDWHWVYNAVIADPHLNPSDKLVYSSISTFGGHTVIHPTVKQIAERCNLSERAVQESIKRLEEVEYLSMDKSTGRGNANVYYLLKSPKGCKFCTFTKRCSLEQERVQNTTLKGELSAPHIDKKDKKDSSEQSSHFTIEPDQPKEKKPKEGTKEYDDLITFLDALTGVRTFARGKPYAALKAAREANISKSRLKQRAEELFNEDFYQEKGLDWGMVVSSFNRKA